jgi:ribosomal protein S18 acetylase RimI-like enzyme
MTTMVEALIRPMGPGDMAAVRAVLRASNVQFEDKVPKPLFDAYLANVLDLESRLDQSTTMLATWEGRTVGTVTYYADANDEGVGPTIPRGTAGIRAVAVDPSARGLGIGGRLAAAAVDLARGDGATAIVLHTWAVMTSAIRLYEGIGFRRAPTYDAGSRDFFPTGIDEDPPALAFWLDL